MTPAFPALDEIRTVLNLAQAFFAYLLERLRPYADPAYPTLVTDGKRIRINPEYFTALLDSERVFAICHEVMHVVLEHPQMMRHYKRLGQGPDGKPFNHRRFNVAGDLIINAILNEMHVGTMPAGCLIHPAFPSTMSVPDAYCALPDIPPEEGCGGVEAADGGSDDDADDGDPAGKAGQRPITPADVLVAAALAKAAGQLSPVIERLVGLARRPVVSSWAVLRRQIQTRRKGADTVSWRRLNRRLVVRNIGAPTAISQGTDHAVIVVDTSGSISRPVLQMFAHHATDALAACRPAWITVIWADDGIRKIEKFSDISAVRRALQDKAYGGGGTDMRVPVAAALKLKPSVIVVLTDGETPWPGPEAARVVWAVTTSQKAPHGVTVGIAT